MEIQQDFKELLRLFQENHVDFLIVGGYALAFHGAPRFTGDIDVYVKPDEDNAIKILKALDEFGFGGLGISVEDLSVEEKVLQLGVPPVRVDIITSLSGITWEEAYKNREKGFFADLEVFFIGKSDFIKNKRATSRKRDLSDIEELGEI
ncbi:MAG: hypothetical protein KC733_09740 [Candidatus Omnitrophica bacterium]|nr:hypothetical protein [Candidatus Omnitrophota bacterium]